VAIGGGSGRNRELLPNQPQPSRNYHVFMSTLAFVSGNEIHDPALQISFGVVAGLIILIALVLIIRRRRERRELEREGRQKEGPWWRGPYASTKDDPVIYRHGDQSGGGG
jgi:flagellar biosynthesis/type III secretory pathway M-ring protein FliF/YscJ